MLSGGSHEDKNEECSNAGRAVCYHLCVGGLDILGWGVLDCKGMASVKVLTAFYWASETRDTVQNLGGVFEDEREGLMIGVFTTNLPKVGFEELDDPEGFLSDIEDPQARVFGAPVDVEVASGGLEILKDRLRALIIAEEL